MFPFVRWISDLDTMLYGYTNNIYVLDHTPESLPVSTTRGASEQLVSVYVI